MSWPQAWITGVPSVPTIPSVPTASAMPAGYTPEQWTQMQQNWQQWTQWQQQYQQWHQQYGEEYQKLNTISPLPIAQPQPPLPQEPKPPLPPGDPPPPLPPDNTTAAAAAQSQAAQFNFAGGYHQAPPPQHHHVPSYSSAPMPVAAPIPVGAVPMVPPPDQSWKMYGGGGGGVRPIHPPQQHQLQRSFNQPPPSMTGSSSQFPRMSYNQPPPLQHSGQAASSSALSASHESSANKRRNFNNDADVLDSKRNRNNSDQNWSNRNQPPHQQRNQQQREGSSDDVKAEETLDDLTLAEVKFDKQFAEWEAQFDKWKSQNENHPDKEQYREYEKKWETWRAQLLDRREQMRKKREQVNRRIQEQQAAAAGAGTDRTVITPGGAPANVKETATPAKPSPAAAPSNFSTQPQTPAVTSMPPRIDTLNKPPPFMNNEPLQFNVTAAANSASATVEIIDLDQPTESPSANTGANDTASKESQDEVHADFLSEVPKSTGIPGLDMDVVIDLDDDQQSPPPQDKQALGMLQGPDLDAISKNINSILGDSKLLSMLSMVQQNKPPVTMAPETRAGAGGDAHNMPGQGNNAFTTNQQWRPDGQQFGAQPSMNNANWSMQQNWNTMPPNQDANAPFHNQQQPGFQPNNPNNLQFNKGNNFNKPVNDKEAVPRASRWGNKNPPQQDPHISIPNFIPPSENNTHNEQNSMNRPPWQMDQQQQMSFDQSQRPPFDQSQRPPFDQSQRPLFDQDQRPPFGQPLRPPFEQPQRPPFDQGQRPPFDQSQRPPFDQAQRPPFGQPHRPPFDAQGPRNFENESGNSTKRESGGNWRGNQPNNFGDMNSFNDHNQQQNRGAPPSLMSIACNKPDDKPSASVEPEWSNEEDYGGEYDDGNFFANEDDEYDNDPFANENDANNGPVEQEEEQEEQFDDEQEDPFAEIPQQEPFDQQRKRGPFDQRNEEVRFDQRNEGRFDQRQQGQFDQRKQGRFDQRQEGPFDQRQPQGPFGNRQQGGFNQRRQGDFDQRQPGGFDQRQQADFEQRQQEGFDQRQQGDFDQRQKGGFNQRQQGDFDQRKPPQAPFDQQQNQSAPIAQKIEQQKEEDTTPEWSGEVIEYDHKPPKREDVTVEPLQSFDYRHRPANRVPYPERPRWLQEILKQIKEFDPTIRMQPGFTNMYDPPNSNTGLDNRYPPHANHMQAPPPGGNQYHPAARIDSNRMHFERPPFNNDRSPFHNRPPFNNERPPFNNERPPFNNDRPNNMNLRPPFNNRGGQHNQDRRTMHHQQQQQHNRNNAQRKPENSSSRQGSRISPDRFQPINSPDAFDDNEGKGEGDENKGDSGTMVFEPPPSKKAAETVTHAKQQSMVAIKNQPIFPSAAAPTQPSTTTVKDLLELPGRLNRPPRFVIILRGPPGSGKTYLAKLIKDTEVENGGSAPRILSLDDYFMVEKEQMIMEDGKPVSRKEMVFEYEDGMEESYRQSLLKSFKRTITDGYFPFIIVDNINDKLKYFGEMWSFAKNNGFQAYVCQLELDVQLCTKRNIHNRTEEEIKKIVDGWEKSPQHHTVLDADSLLQEGSIADVEMETIDSPPSDAADEDEEEDDACRSKWDTFDCSIGNLAKLDGISKPLRPSNSMEDYLQLEEECGQPTNESVPGKKRVRWADLEERRSQQKMRDIGFVVGQTDWNRMMDPTMGSSALTQTKYIERASRYTLKKE